MTLLVCGEALFDFFQNTGAEDGSLAFDAVPGGSPFNVAIGVARQAGTVGLLAGISEDQLGQRLCRHLEAEGVDTGYLHRSGRRTTVSLVALDAQGQPDYAFYGVGSADIALTPGDMPELPEAVQALHFGSYSIAVAPAADAFAHLAHRHGDRFISLDPNVRATIEPDMTVWRARIDALRPQCDLIKVSAEDLELLWPDTSPEEIARGWHQAGTPLVVMTAGADQVVAFHHGERVAVPVPAGPVVDTVGAGDAFMATLLRGLQGEGAFREAEWTSRIDLRALLGEAITAAGIVCSRRGADMPVRADLSVR